MKSYELEPILRDIAQAYENATHDPLNDEIRESYRVFIVETIAQFRAMPVEVRFTTDDPYKTSAQLFDDCSTGFMRVFKTATDSLPINHPIAGEWNTPLKAPNTAVWGRFTVNDAFRAVHDWYGHYVMRAGFGWRGELRAWWNHSRMYSPLAQRALFTETVGQLAWFYFGPHADKPRNERPFAEQKACVMPIQLECALYDALLYHYTLDELNGERE